MNSTKSLRSLVVPMANLMFFASLLAFESRAFGQAQPEPEKGAKEQPPSTIIEIPDEPKTIDPATLVPAKLAAVVTVDFAGKSLKDVVTWLQDEQKINVLLDYRALAQEKILVGEPVSDQSNKAPLYLLLNRLRTLGLAWYLRDGTLHITTQAESERHLTTINYNLGDLFDAKYEPETLIETITGVTSGRWEQRSGEGGTSVLLGDVLFIRQTDKVHREVAGLLAALRKHARRTFILNPPQQAILRLKLDQNVTVDFQETPLVVAVQELSRQVQADIRLDTETLTASGVRERVPVSLKLADQKLSSVLRALLANHALTWDIRDNVLWITTMEKADELHMTAVFDVRDLCRDQEESMALGDAVKNQSRAKWEEVDGEGGTLIFPKPGVMVVRTTERDLDDVLELLENYRAALRASKPRKRGGLDPKEVITRYYRLPAVMADDLKSFMPLFVSPESWKGEAHPDADGTISKIVSRPGLLNAMGFEVQAEKPKDQPKTNALVVENSVLIIRQSREVHESIVKFIHKVESGDPIQSDFDAPKGMGGGGQQGGFGGGFFSVNPK